MTFLRPTTSQNELGEQTTTWEDNAKVWATVSPSGGRRADETGEVRLTEGLRVWCRLLPFVTERYRLAWRGETYAIENMVKEYTEGRMTFNLARL